MNPTLLYPTLYTPGTSSARKLLGLMNGENRLVRRLVVCTEDAIQEEDVPRAFKNITDALSGVDDNSPTAVFVRVRSLELMARLLDTPHVGRLAGFVVPKVDPTSFPAYADQVLEHDEEFRLMPILESPFMTSRQYRELLHAVLRDSRYVDLIDCLRIGANDLLGYQGIRRDDHEFTIYDTPVGITMLEILNEFRGTGGFTVTAPVFECFAKRYDDLFRREVRHNVLNGLFGQTVIHPRHLPLLWDMYAVKATELESANRIHEKSVAVLGSNGKMDEKATHGRWAEIILARADLFGVS